MASIVSPGPGPGKGPGRAAAIAVITIAVVAGAAALPDAAAQQASSTYSAIDITKCRVTGQNRESGSISWACPGAYGLMLFVAEGDLRMFVAAGRKPHELCAAHQTLGAFNTIGGRLEWRLRNGRPFATIVRYKTDVDGVRNDYLVVSRLGNQSCHVAYVPGATPRQNEVARAAADRFAEGFDCKSDRAFVYDGAEKTTDGQPGPGDVCPR